MENPSASRVLVRNGRIVADGRVEPGEVLIEGERIGCFAFSEPDVGSDLGNISCHLRRDIRFDPKTETFGPDKAANAYLTKQYRKEYPLPKT